MGVQLNRAGGTPPCVLHEDEDLLVVSKPAGWNTHAPSPWTGEGIYEWLRDREARWAGLSILHRLDKDTSGVLVFGLGERANRSLHDQFAERAVRKRYRLRVDGEFRAGAGTVRAEALPGGGWRVISWLSKAGDRQVSRREGPEGEEAVTEFEPVGAGEWLARPRTGRTHQIRVHAAAMGAPIRGDRLYGGRESVRLWLHSESIAFVHPADGRAVEFTVPGGFDRVVPGHGAICGAVWRPDETDAGRLIHGAASGLPGVYAERLGDWVLVQSEGECELAAVRERLGGWQPRGIYHKRLRRDVRRTTVAETSPVLVEGEASPERFGIRENGVEFEVSFGEGYSVGLFLDQRDNRRRLLRGHVAAGFPMPAGAGLDGVELLNCFAYTGGFSVCGALAGARTTTLDLSRKYLDWARRNFVRNGLDPAAHDFIYGDCFDWMARLAKKGRRFGAVLLDPPTFSRSKESGDFRAESDYGRLVELAARLLSPDGILFASTNAARLEPERFLGMVREGVARGGRRAGGTHYSPQPPDFPVTRDEPAYLKTVWVRCVG